MAEINYDITIDDQNQYVVELNEQGPQGANGEDGNGIVNITKTSTSGLIDTYTINYTNGGTDSFTVTNGNGIQSISKTSTSGLNDTYTIEFTNGTNTTFVVTNGSNISSIAKTATAGLVDTYTVTLTNGNTSTFTVTNGYSPTATVTKDGSETTITITDKNGTTTSTVYDGTLPSEAIKGYLDAGENLTDEKGLADVKNYAHSTFDISKFTAVGSPTVTNDGIAYNFTAGNYYKATITTGQNNFDIITRFYYTAAGTAQNVWYIGNYYNLTISSANEIQLRLPNDNNSWYRQVMTFTPSQEGWIWVRYSVQGDTTYAYTSENGSQWTPRGNAVTYSYQYLTNAIISIGSTASLAFADKIDLKNFYVNVAGKTVFSGNKTGVDIVKPDSYTVTGSPSVTSDGVTSGFSASNYIQTFNSDLFANPFELYFGFNSTDVTTRETIIGMQTSFGLNIAIRNSKLLFGASSNGTSLDIASNVESTSTINTNTFYLGRLKWTGTTYTLALYINNVWIDYITISSSSAIIGNQSVNIGLINSLYPYANGEIDLNAYKLYVDNNLVYQPCLKIPYTLSKTGSKIVDSVYRYRVNDMYNQYGYAPYYTLSSTDYSLPCGELYGLYNRIGASSAMPSIKYTDLTLAATNTPYTAPSDGYFYLDKTTTASGQVVILALRDTAGNTVMQSYCVSSDTGQKLRTYLPVYRGSIVVPIYTAAGTTNTFRFVYAQGSEVEK